MAKVKTAAKIVVASLAALVIIGAAVLAMTFFSQAEEEVTEQAQAALASELDAYKNGDPTRLEGNDMAELEELGIDPAELKSVLTEGFSYQFTGADYYPKSDAVIVHATVDSRQLVSAAREVLPDVYASMFESAYNGATEAELKAIFVDHVMESIEEEPLTTTQIDVEMLHRNGQWVVSASGERQVQRAIMGNLNSLYEDIESINTTPKVDEAAIAEQVANAA